MLVLISIRQRTTLSALNHRQLYSKYHALILSWPNRWVLNVLEDHIRVLMIFRESFLQSHKKSVKILTVSQDDVLRDCRSLEEPEGAMLCERPSLVLPLPHEEDIHRHGLTVLTPHYAALEE